jgi:hypothetical protein
MCVPNVFHFVFGLRPQSEPFHLMHFLCLASCIAVNRPTRIVFHCEHEPWGPYWDRIRPALEIRHIAPNQRIANFQYADPSVARYRYAHLADIARLEILLAEGGIYADMDTLFVAPLPGKFFDQSCTLGRERADFKQNAIRSAGGSLCNAWIMAERGAPFVASWLERFWTHFDGSWSGHSTSLPYQMSCERPDLVSIEPESSFFYLSWTPAGIRALFENRVALPQGIYSLHLWSHLWWERERRDFSCFHKGRLTPAYVRNAESTYAEFARPYLPADIPAQDLAAWQRQKILTASENNNWIAAN